MNCNPLRQTASFGRAGMLQSLYVPPPPQSWSARTPTQSRFTGAWFSPQKSFWFLQLRKNGPSWGTLGVPGTGNLPDDNFQGRLVMALVRSSSGLLRIQCRPILGNGLGLERDRNQNGRNPGFLMFWRMADGPRMPKMNVFFSLPSTCSPPFKTCQFFPPFCMRVLP